MKLDSIWNFQESLVREHIHAAAGRYPRVAEDEGLLADVGCLALNALRPRYVRFTVDLHFFMTDKERADNAAAVDRAVHSAFEQVQRNLGSRAARGQA